MESSAAPEQSAAETLKHVEALDRVQRDLESLEDEATEKVLELQAEYNRKKRPLYEKRANVLRAIPEFWYITLAADPLVGQMIQERDVPLLKQLRELQVSFKDAVKDGFRVSFHFDANDFLDMTPCVLELRFEWNERGVLEITRREAVWKAGRDLSAPTAEQSAKAWNDGEKAESFFGWYAGSSAEHRSVCQHIAENIWPNPDQIFALALAEEDGGNIE